MTDPQAAPVAANDNFPVSGFTLEDERHLPASGLDKTGGYDFTARPDAPLRYGASIWHGGPSIEWLIRQAAAVNAANDNTPLPAEPIATRARGIGIGAEYALGWFGAIYETVIQQPSHPAGVPAMLDAQRRLCDIAKHIGCESTYTLIAGLAGATAEDIGRCYGKTYKRASAHGSLLLNAALSALEGYFFEVVPLAA